MIDHSDEDFDVCFVAKFHEPVQGTHGSASQPDGGTGQKENHLEDWQDEEWEVRGEGHSCMCFKMYLSHVLFSCTGCIWCWHGRCQF